MTHSSRPQVTRLSTALLLGMCLFAGQLAWAQGPSSVEPQTAKGTQSQPNIVYIMLDEWGYHEWSGAGHPIHQTPNIDRMAKEGMRFTQMLAGSCVCAPTRSTLMTGQHTGHTTVRGNGGTAPIRHEDVTIAEVLAGAGYAAGGFGKWGLGDRGTSGVPERQGFDTFFGYYHQVHAHTYYPNYLVRNSEKVVLPGNTGHAFQGETFSQYLIHDEAKAFIRKHAGKTPFFAYLPYTIPHAFYGIPKDDPAYLRFKDRPWDAPQHHRNPKVAPPDEAQRYAAFVALADRQIGEILSLLDELGIDDDTIVFLCGDNGANTSVFLDGEHPNGFFAPNVDPRVGTIFRGGKGDLHEGGLRVAYMVRWPGKIAADSVSDHLGYFPDVMPTLAALGGTEAPEEIDGISFLPTLLGEGHQPSHGNLYWEYRNQVAVREGRWKAVQNRKSQVWELYDLATDVGEQVNVASKNADVVARLASIAKKSRTEPRHGAVLDPTLGFKGHASR